MIRGQYQSDVEDPYCPIYVLQVASVKAHSALPFRVSSSIDQASHVDCGLARSGCLGTHYSRSRGASTSILSSRVDYRLMAWHVLMLLQFVSFLILIAVVYLRHRHAGSSERGREGAPSHDRPPVVSERLTCPLRAEIVSSQALIRRAGIWGSSGICGPGSCVGIWDPFSAWTSLS